MSVLPILFNTDMVRAIMDGRKTVTRRVCKDGNDFTVPDMGFYDADRRTYAVHNYANKEHTDKLSLGERTCPICPEDTLYVRERFCKGKIECGENPDGTDAPYVSQENADTDFIPYEYCVRNNIGIEDVIWKPSIHMPKEVARIWLKVTDVRVERLQDISGMDVLKEGVNSHVHPEADYFDVNQREMFQSLWNSTIDKKQIDTYGWDANPWVWVIEFERCEKPE